MELTAENLDGIVAKAERLRELLDRDPRILRFMELTRDGFNEAVQPKVDRLIGPTEVCKILKISSKTLVQWEKEHRLIPRYTPSSNSKYWLSQVMDLVRDEPYR